MSLRTLICLSFSLLTVTTWFSNSFVCANIKKGHECKLREYNFTAVKKDSSGKRCRDKIQSFACFGGCETLEYGTADFPHKAGVQTACQFDKFADKTTELKFCEPGASDEAKTYTYTDALTCRCTGCNPSTTNCVSGIEVKKKRTFPDIGEDNFNSRLTHWEEIKESLTE